LLIELRIAKISESGPATLRSTLEEWVWFVAAWEAAHGDGLGLIARLVDEAASQCPGHIVVRL
jgi:hypothetical protein